MVAAREKSAMSLTSQWCRSYSNLLAKLGDNILDPGCARGYLSRLLAERGAHVTGVDISPRLIEMARAKGHLGGISYIAHNLSQPLPAMRST